jgi:hypothetical protein
MECKQKTMSDNVSEDDAYTCEACGGTFRKIWSDEDAVAKMHAVFGDIPPDKRSVVCDDCYVAIMGRRPDDA